MKKQLFPLLILSFLLLASCHSKTIADEEHTFDGDTWNRFAPEVFDFTVGNNQDYYNIDISATVDTALFRYSELPVMLILHSPGGEERQFYGAVVFRDKGRWRGETAGTRCTASGRIRSYFSFNHRGNHQLKVSHQTSQYDLEGIHSLTLTVTKAKVDYDL